MQLIYITELLRIIEKMLFHVDELKIWLLNTECPETATKLYLYIIEGKSTLWV